MSNDSNLEQIKKEFCKTELLNNISNFFKKNNINFLLKQICIFIDTFLDNSNCFLNKCFSANSAYEKLESKSFYFFFNLIRFLLL